MFNPCCCITNCNVCADAFALSDSTDVSTGTACGYTEESGNWERVSGRVQTSNSSAILSINTSSTGNNTLLVQSNVEEVNKSLRLIFDFVDSDNYLCAEFISLSTSWITPRIIVRAAGIETIVATGVIFPWGTWNFLACYHDSTGLFVASSHSGFGTFQTTVEVAVSYATSPPNGVLAIGTGPSLPSALWFDNLDIDLTTATGGLCQECPKCTECSVAPAAERYVTLSGLQGAGTCCATCSSFDGDYVLNYAGIARFRFGALNFLTCVWLYKFPSTTCNYNFLYAFPDTIYDSWLVLLARFNMTIGTGINLPWLFARKAGAGLVLPADCDTVSMVADAYGINTTCAGGDTGCEPGPSVVCELS